MARIPCADKRPDWRLHGGYNQGAPGVRMLHSRRCRNPSLVPIASSVYPRSVRGGANVTVNRVDAAKEIAAPPDRVYNAIADYAQRPQWSRRPTLATWWSAGRPGERHGGALPAQSREPRADLPDARGRGTTRLDADRERHRFLVGDDLDGEPARQRLDMSRCTPSGRAPAASAASSSDCSRPAHSSAYTRTS